MFDPEGQIWDKLWDTEDEDVPGPGYIAGSSLMYATLIVILVIVWLCGCVLLDLLLFPLVLHRVDPWRLQNLFSFSGTIDMVFQL